MKITYENILNKLPKDYNSLLLKDYLKIINCNDIQENEDIFINMDNVITIISKLTDYNKEDIENLKTFEVQSLINQISFISSMPISTNSKYSIKKLEKISYSNYIDYIQLSEQPLVNIIQILKTMIKGKITIEEIENLNMNEVQYLIEDLKKKLKLYQIHFLRQQTIQNLKLTTKAVFKKIFTIKKKK